MRSRSSSMTCDGVRPSGPGSCRPASTWSCSAGDADGEELVEVGGEDGQELQALQQRHVVLLGQLSTRVVELEPGELAVVVEPRVVEVARVGLAAPAPGGGTSRIVCCSAIVTAVGEGMAADGVVAVVRR